MTQFLLIAAAIPLVGFIICYGFFSPWWKTLQGKLLLTQKFAMLALIVFWLLDPEFPGRDIVRLALISTLVLLFWAMFLSLVWVQNTSQKVTRRTGTGLIPENEIEHTQPRKPVYRNPKEKR